MKCENTAHRRDAPSLILALLCLASWCRAGESAPLPSAHARLNPYPYLAGLGELIQRTVPPNFSIPDGGALWKRATDTERARVLPSRLAEVGIESKPPSSTPGLYARAPEVLIAVNATLGDFTPENLRGMTAERLNALAAVVFDQLRLRPRQSVVDEGTALIAGKRLEILTELSARPARRIVHNPGAWRSDKVEHSTNWGVPQDARLAQVGVPFSKEPYGSRVYRHYGAAESIMKSSRLWNGIGHYVRTIDRCEREDFLKLTGAFLTLPSADLNEVLRPGRPHDDRPLSFVDVQISSNFSILEILPGKIFLIPMPPSPMPTDGYKEVPLTFKFSPNSIMAKAIRGIAGIKSWIAVNPWAADDDPERLQLGPDLTVPARVVNHGLLPYQGPPD